MPNCLSYAVRGDLQNNYPNGYNNAYQTLNQAMDDQGGNAANWQNGSALLSLAMAGNSNQKLAGTTFLNAITGGGLLYTKRTSQNLGPTNNALGSVTK